MLRVDVAGNMSKRFSASGLRVPKFSGACPRWNVFGAFLTPGVIHTQLSQMPDGQILLRRRADGAEKKAAGFTGLARSTRFHSGATCLMPGKMVYADGLDLKSREALVPRRSLMPALRANGL